MEVGQRWPGDGGNGGVGIGEGKIAGEIFFETMES